MMLIANGKSPAPDSEPFGRSLAEFGPLGAIERLAVK
jgi:hypothetical protein